MKTKLFLLMLLLISSSIVTAQKNEIAEIKSNLKKEQQKVNRLFNEQKNVIAKYQMVVIDSRKVMTRVDSLRNKPDSPAYKKAVKKAESLSKEQNELSVSIANSKHQIDSINQIIAKYKTQLQELKELQAKSKKESKKEVQRGQKKEKSSKQSHTEKNRAIYTDSKDISEEHKEKLSEESLEVLNLLDEHDTDNKEEAIRQQNETTSQEANDDIELDFWSYLYLIGGSILFIFLTYLQMKKSMRCPKCGRWGTFEEIGRTTDGKTSNGGGGYTYIHRIKYRCQNCGYRKEKEVRTNAKNKYDVH